MGYHKRKIQKGELGKISKIIEEIEELEDAEEQNCKIMAQVELADIYGALEEYAKTYNLTMDDLKSMSDITKRAFNDGSRR
jgi:hypothetical protein